MDPREYLGLEALGRWQYGALSCSSVDCPTVRLVPLVGTHGQYARGKNGSRAVRHGNTHGGRGLPS